MFSLLTNNVSDVGAIVLGSGHGFGNRLVKELATNGTNVIDDGIGFLGLLEDGSP